jgi:hypothetical protein
LNKLNFVSPLSFSKEGDGGGTAALTILIILTLLNFVRDAEGGEAGTAPEERSDEGIAEAKAKPVAARPERNGTATSEGHAQIISIIL